MTTTSTTRAAPPRWKEGLFGLFLLVSLALTMFPFLCMMLEVLAPPLTDMPGSLRYHPRFWSLDSFRRLFAIGDISRFLFNSMTHALGYMTLSLTLNSLAAFAFARLAFPGRDRLFTLLILTMMVPSQVIMIPVFLIVKSLGLLNSYDCARLRPCLRHLSHASVHDGPAGRDL